MDEDESRGVSRAGFWRIEGWKLDTESVHATFPQDEPGGADIRFVPKERKRTISAQYYSPASPISICSDYRQRWSIEDEYSNFLLPVSSRVGTTVAL